MMNNFEAFTRLRLIPHSSFPIPHSPPGIPHPSFRIHHSIKTASGSPAAAASLQ
jgi:hypothetical protein